MKVPMVLTSHDRLGDTGRKTGSWLEEFAAPTLCSGTPPIDPKNDLPEEQTPAMARFKEDKVAQKALAETVRLSEMKSANFDTIFRVGGHGPMWDLVDNPDSIRLIESFYNSGKPVAAVCHSPVSSNAVCIGANRSSKENASPALTDGEEAAMNLTRVVPFLVGGELKRIGSIYEKAADRDWESFANRRRSCCNGSKPRFIDGCRQSSYGSLESGNRGSVPLESVEEFAGSGNLF